MIENKFATFIDCIINLRNIFPTQHERLIKAIPPETVLFEVTAAYDELIVGEDFTWSYHMDTPSLPPYDYMFFQWDGRIVDEGINCNRWQGVLIRHIVDRRYHAIAFSHGIDYRIFISRRPYELVFNENGGFEDVHGLLEWNWEENKNQRNLAKQTMQQMAMASGAVLSDAELEGAISKFMLNPMANELTAACITTTIHALALIHQRRDIEFVDYTRAERRRLKKKTDKNPSPYFRICPITPNKSQSRYSDSQSTGRKNAVHTVRGHFRHYESGRVTWVRSHLRGSKHHGISEKSYQIRLD